MPPATSDPGESGNTCILRGRAMVDREDTRRVEFLSLPPVAPAIGTSRRRPPVLLTPDKVVDTTPWT